MVLHVVFKWLLALNDCTQRDHDTGSAPLLVCMSISEPVLVLLFPSCMYAHCGSIWSDILEMHALRSHSLRDCTFRHDEA